MADPAAPLGQRGATMTLLGQMGDAQAEQTLEQIVGGTEADPVKIRALAALAGYSDSALNDRILALYPQMDSSLRAKARGLLEARAGSAVALLRAVDRGQLSQSEVPSAEVRKISAFPDDALAALIFKHYGRVNAQSTGQHEAMVISVMHIIPRHKGLTDPQAGRKVFLQMCSACHTLFGEGGHIGPDLTSVDRMNTQFMVDNIVSPSLTIRPEFIAYNASLTDGRTLTGFMAASDDQTVTIRDVSDQHTVVPRAKIKSLDASPISLMPEGLLESLDEQQIADLFSYLQLKSAL